MNIQALLAVSASWLVVQCGAISNLLQTELSNARSEPESFAVRVVREVEHAGAPWTQGLEFSEDGKRLVETCGSYPEGTQSEVRTLDPRTGKVLTTTSEGLSEGGLEEGGRFVEGIVQLEAGPEAHWFASTYKDHAVVEYDAEFNPVGEHKYPFEGWGLTRNADRTAFLATNSSDKVIELLPGSFEVASVKTATCLGRPVKGINELEMVDDFQGRGPALLGNVYGTRVIAALDPATMRCIGVFHLEGLEPFETVQEEMGFHVANGIAFNRHTGNFVITGKNWKKMFEIRLEDEGPFEGGGSRAVELLALHVQGVASVGLTRLAESLRSGRSTKRHKQKSSRVF